MPDVTEILNAIEDGDPSAADELLPLIYDELRKLAAARMAQESPDHTLQATALVHEAYLRLVDVHKVQKWDSRGHFYSAAAEAMRRILVDAARHRQSLKAGGGHTRIDLDQAEVAFNPPPDEILALDDALTKLAVDDPLASELTKLRLFAGLTIDDAAAVVGMSRTTAFRQWAYAPAFLLAEFQTEDA